MTSENKSPRRGRRPRVNNFNVEIVRATGLPPNRENPYAALSAAERYECFMKRLGEIWAAISKRRARTLEGTAKD